jgi:uncharacterized tellurite resistance protein B-like protein
MNNDQPINYSCPYCEGRKIETAAIAPYVRGFGLAYQTGSKSFIGCTSCVRTKVLGEAGLSSLLGWFSITAVVINPFLIVYNLLQAPFIRTNYAMARQMLNDVGIPDDESNESNVDVTQLGYSLATSMIAADWQIDEDEIVVALTLGKQLFPDFNEEEFREVVKAGDIPPPQDIATLLREILSDEGKEAICSYLWMIAKADGKIDNSEINLLIKVATNMGVDPEKIMGSANLKESKIR